MVLETALFVGLLLHLFGDYVIQSSWMALEKTSNWWPAIVHAVTYGLPFLILTQNPWAIGIIVGTHAVIDRYRLARHLCWAKNFMAPRGYNRPWSECRATGYPESTPIWLATWLMIVADNTVHLMINSAVLWWVFA